MLTEIQTELRGLVRNTWAQDVLDWGKRVALYRQYAAGDHRAKLTDEMKKMLRVDDSRLDRFNANYCGLVAQAVSDRLTVTSIEGSSPEATAWAKEVQENNRFDTLQMDVHESLMIDGDTFVIAAWDKAEGCVFLAHEPAFDGEVGMIPVYDRMRRKLVAAVKIWWEGNALLVNFYMPGEVKKYTWLGTEEKPNPKLVVRDDAADWTDNQNAALGVPVIHFKNRASTYAWHGESELVNAIPLQDVLNRTITSMVMTSELSAFQILFAVGFDVGPSAALRPGGVINVKDTISKEDNAPTLTPLQQATLVPFISEAEFTIDQISAVTQTPLLSSMGGSSSSGEALKQRETGLIGKVRKTQTRAGNSWEDTIKMAARLQGTYGTNKAPDSKLWRTQWQDASPRNDTEMIDNAMKTRDVVGDEETLREIGKVRGYDEEKIQEIMAQKDEAASKALNNSGLPGFDQFGVGTDLNQIPGQAQNPVIPQTPQQQPNPVPNNPNTAQTIDVKALQDAMMQMGA